MTNPVLHLDSITKRFGPLLAVDAVSLRLRRGEVLALLGENGAGKTTLVNVLFGHYRADAGTVTVDGTPLPPESPRAAIGAGVGMVHQHFALASNLTVLDNVALGLDPLWLPWSRRAAVRARLLAASEKFGLPVDPDARVADLSVGERQRVEILKALVRDARILVLDEPTAVLARPEAEALFATLRAMTAEGLSILLISHKMAEVMAADRVAVLRAGRLVAERATAETTPEELAELMVGAKVARPRREAHRPGPPVLAAEGLSLRDKGRTLLDGASFTLRAGEVLGIVGVAGNGQAALGRVLMGLQRPDAGSVLLDGREAPATPRALVAAGVGRVPEDRLAEGVAGDLLVWENATLDRLRTPALSRAGIVRRGAARAFAADLIARFDLRGGGPDARTARLSGGNIQKLILARALSGSPRVVLAFQPTRGLDEGAVAAVHARLLDARAQGAAILLVTEDLDEALALSDRLQAIVAGRLSLPIPAEEADARRLGLLMAGRWEAHHAA